ncbi:MAG: hypothetical protein FWC38_02395 [Proteobacteria bacterium]|nr:hypothetical protein [Pseudomonadota bacterium]
MSLTRRRQAITAIREHLAEYGSCKWGLIRPRFQDVPDATWWNWVRIAKDKNAVNSLLNVAKKAAKKTTRKKKAPPVIVPQNTKASPITPDTLIENLQRARNVDILNEIQQALLGCEKLERFASHESGEIKLHKAYQSAQMLRLRAVDVYIAAFRAVWDIQRIQLLHNLVVEAVGSASPEMARRIMERLEAADAAYSLAATPGEDDAMRC